MKEITAVIVDDEDLARMIIREHLAAFPDIRLAAECSNGFEALKQIAAQKPQILFLDIQMPKINGFEVLELLTHRCEVIFVTAYDQYALKAFEVHAVDYLLKPFSKSRFNEAVTRALERIAAGISGPADALKESIKKEAPLSRILVRDGETVHVIPVETVRHIEAQDDYVEIHAGGKKYLKQQSLAELETLLDAHRFVRIHRSTIVNVECIARIELYAKDSRVAILNDGKKLLISRTGYDRLKEHL
jgi:two-component system LytT family response regulator